MTYLHIRQIFSCGLTAGYFCGCCMTGKSGPAIFYLHIRQIFSCFDVVRLYGRCAPILSYHSATRRLSTLARADAIPNCVHRLLLCSWFCVRRTTGWHAVQSAAQYHTPPCAKWFAPYTATFALHSQRARIFALHDAIAHRTVGISYRDTLWESCQLCCTVRYRICTNIQVFL